MTDYSKVLPAAAEGMALLTVAPTNAVQVDPNVEVINQTYRECLNALYERDYYQIAHSNTIQYARIFDYAIGLGSAVSGGSGLGILADPKFAWLCGTVTTVSVLLSVAKGVWDWPGKANFALQRVQFYQKLYSNYQRLVDDVNAAKKWTEEFAEKRNKLRDGATPEQPDPNPELNLATKRRIQNDIKSRLKYTSWWQWKA
ncbi:hypothetical protein JQ615_41960 [Bradyrhizobium jicamae]|uniref:SMODS and SLOG-associating 2TM effector domain-containing protein n=1 Tax=Bradyrhizobium jicamae TaxID=280332 RepID=A0ABS5FYU4_9BRAD|nr:hypothetical protein [Bradyrhizobium jicamae]MBR0801895.1 hypothetical protein [Bradyrhizobium jicamae]